MDNISLEIAVMIIENLEELDIPPETLSTMVEAPTDSLSLHRRPAYDLAWHLHKSDSRTNICNARLACRKFYNASFKSFGCILGDRRFRLTMCGMQDLRGIGNLFSLKPYIRTLTFGSACFLPPDHQLLHLKFRSLGSEERDRRISAYNRCARWQEQDPCTLQEQLSIRLQAFPKLACIRVVMTDHPTELDGCPGLGRPDVEVKQTKGDARHIEVINVRQLYRSTSSSFMPDLFKALDKANSDIEDLRFDQSHPLTVHPSFAQVSGLRTLRMRISPSSALSLKKVLMGMPYLEDLALSLQQGSFNCREMQTQWSNDRLAGGFKMTKWLLEALHHQKLHRLELSGGFVFAATDLLALIERYAQSLHCLILGYPALRFGSWLPALDKIAAMTKDKLQFLSVRWPSEVDSHDSNLIWFNFDTIEEFQEKLLSFAYPVDLEIPSSHKFRKRTYLPKLHQGDKGQSTV